MRYANMLRKMTFAAATAAALAFGGSQAVASPAREAGAPQCDPDRCAERCAAEGLIGLCSGRGCYCR